MPTKKPNFVKDDAFTKFYENVMLSLVSWTDAVPAPKKRWTAWDLKIKNKRRVDTYELKADRRTEGTGNLAIEINSLGFLGDYKINPSGLNSTKADYYAYFNHNSKTQEWWLIPTVVLRKIVEEQKPKFYAWVGEPTYKGSLVSGKHKGRTEDDIKMEKTFEMGDKYSNTVDLGGKAFCAMYPKSVFSQYKMAPWVNWLDKKDGKYIIPNYMDITYTQMGDERKIVEDISTLEKPTDVSFEKEEVGGEETEKIVHKAPTREQETQTSEEGNGKEMKVGKYEESSRPDVAPVAGRTHRKTGEDVPSEAKFMERDIKSSIEYAESQKAKKDYIPGGRGARFMTAKPRDINNTK